MAVEWKIWNLELDYRFLASECDIMHNHMIPDYKTV